MSTPQTPNLKAPGRPIPPTLLQIPVPDSTTGVSNVVRAIHGGMNHIGFGLMLTHTDVKTLLNVFHSVRRKYPHQFIGLNLPLRPLAAVKAVPDDADALLIPRPIETFHLTPQQFSGWPDYGFYPLPRQRYPNHRERDEVVRDMHQYHQRHKPQINIIGGFNFADVDPEHPALVLWHAAHILWSHMVITAGASPTCPIDNHRLIQTVETCKSFGNFPLAVAGPAVQTHLPAFVQCQCFMVESGLEELPGVVSAEKVNEKLTMIREARAIIS